VTSTSDYLSWRTRYRCASSDVPEVQSRRGARGGLPGFPVYVQRRYDANAYVTFFERIQADKKRRPGTIPKVFSTHPPTRTWQVNLVSWIIVECSVVFTPGRFPDLRINRGDEREGQTSSDRQ